MIAKTNNSEGRRKKPIRRKSRGGRRVGGGPGGGEGAGVNEELGQEPGAKLPGRRELGVDSGAGGGGGMTEEVKAASSFSVLYNYIKARQGKMMIVVLTVSDEK